MIRKLFRKRFLSEVEFVKFAMWAFGPEWEELDLGREMATAWNNNHFYEYRVSFYGDLQKDMEVMLQLYKDKKPMSVSIHRPKQFSARVQHQLR